MGLFSRDRSTSSRLVFETGSCAVSPHSALRMRAMRLESGALLVYPITQYSLGLAMQWLSLLFVGVLVTVRSQQQEFPYLSFMDNTLVNHSYVDINQLEDDFSNELHCFTDLVSCCRDQDGEHRGNWYSPSGTRLPFTSVEGNIYFSRRTQRVSIRRLGTVTVGHAGIYRCNIQTNVVNSDGQFEVLYVGAYLNGGKNTDVHFTMIIR